MSPNGIEPSKRTAQTLAPQCKRHQNDFPIHQRSTNLIPLGRLGKPEEYASLAVYLASDGHYVVGQTISPNGGMVL